MKDKMIKCRFKKCGIDADILLEIHHIIPKCIGGADKDGRCRLCKKHHIIIHGELLPIVFSFVPDDKKDKCKKAIKDFTEKLIEY